MKNMDEKNWRKRFKYRVDLSSRVTHLTKGETAEEAFRNLINILTILIPGICSSCL